MNPLLRLVHTRRWLALAVAAVVCAGSADAVPAMGMAFRHHKQIFPLGSGAQGRNFTSLPDNSPYYNSTGLTRLCNHLNLSSQGSITQIDAQAGTVNTFNCGQLQTFSLERGVGVIINDTTATDGLIVGSDDPKAKYTFYDLGGSPVGQNVYPVPLNSTATTPEDVCNQCGLSPTASVTRFDAALGNVETHNCTQIPLFTLKEGEALLILEDNGPVTCTPGKY